MHFAFVDANDVALKAMLRAADRGDRVSFVRPHAHRWYAKSMLSIEATARASAIVDIDATNNVEPLADALQGLAGSHQIDGVINVVDATIEATAIACELAGVRFTRASAVCACRDKVKVRKILEEAGAIRPRFALALSVEDAVRAATSIGFPAIVKPASGFGSIATTRVENPEQARSAAEQVSKCGTRFPAVARDLFSRGILVEEYVEGPLISAEIAAINGEWHPIIACGRTVPQYDECCGLGSIVPAHIDPSQRAECFEFAEFACKAVGLDLGVFDVEMFLSEKGPVLTEINARMMGGVMPDAYEAVTGKSFYDQALDVYAGRRPERIAVPEDRFALIRKIIPSEGAVLPRSCAVQWLHDDVRCCRFFNHLIVGGREVGPRDVIGRFMCLADTVQEANAQADALLRDVERRLGIRLMHAQNRFA